VIPNEATTTVANIAEPPDRAIRGSRLDNRCGPVPGRSLSPMAEAVRWVTLRTVCHGCRTMREIIEQVGPHRFASSSMIISGEGIVYRRIQATFESPDAVVEFPCPHCHTCGDDDTVDWLLPGFIPPA
jgi:hypothetical protein